MKKLFLLTRFIIILMESYGQVNYEHTYVRSLSPSILGQEFFLTDLGNNNCKYVMYDRDSSRFNLFNLDHSPFLLNVQIPVMSNLATNTFYQLGYITTTLFDCDSTNIEYAMMLNTPRPSSHPNFAVYRTDGTVLFSKDTVGTVFCIGCGSGSYEMHPIMNTPQGAKLFLFNNDSVPNENIFVYGLCGSLPLMIEKFGEFNSFVNVYPNPSLREINFEIQTPKSNDAFELIIFNSLFETIKIINIQSNIQEAQTRIILNEESLVSGVYFFSLQTNNTVFQTGKFIISK